MDEIEETIGNLQRRRNSRGKICNELPHIHQK